ncbi:MAG: type VI secretion system tip protein VgrG [Balneolaceae bacterium]|nr:MAG: type VI secretion system tip protein VgrG [Balneolaceae bacterium]
MLNGILNRNRQTDLVTFEVLIDSSPLPQTVLVYSIDVWQEFNRIPRAKLAVLDGDPATETFSASEEDWFVPGKEIEIKAGYHNDHSTIFKGIVTSQALKIRSGGRNQLTVDCCDKAVCMTTVPKSRYFYNMKESEIFSEIIRRYDVLSADVEATQYTWKELLQFQSTDWDFVLTRADMNGLFCLVQDGTISIKKPDFSGQPVTEIVFGRNLLEMDAEMEAASQLAGVNSNSWDFSKTEPSSVSASSVNPVIPGNLNQDELARVFQNHEWMMQFGGKIPVEVMQQWADAKLLKHELAKIRGRVRIQGSEILPGNIVALQGIGGRFNGNAYVSGVKHSIGQGEWVTDIQYGLSPKWFSEQYPVSAQPAAGTVPAVSGLQVGIITSIENDPDGDERVMLRLPMINGDDQGLWARVSTTGAGAERGFVFRPEIGDEVIVGFIHDDPNQPVILGSVHSANNPAPITAEDDNDKKGWVTRSEIKFMVEEDKPSIYLEMPSGRKMTLDDDNGEIVFEDSSGNTVIMNSDGITIESGGDLVLKAAGNINISGASVEAKADMNFKASGSAGAEISSSAVTEIKGSLVQIN